jgi:hypothetical protein
LAIVNSAAINMDVQEILFLDLKTPWTKAIMVNAQGCLLFVVTRGEGKLCAQITGRLVD